MLACVTSVILKQVFSPLSTVLTVIVSVAGHSMDVDRFSPVIRVSDILMRGQASNVGLCSANLTRIYILFFYRLLLVEFPFNKLP
jgi:hypothetical protein